jgi:hypothetical protein
LIEIPQPQSPWWHRRDQEVRRLAARQLDHIIVAMARPTVHHAADVPVGLM